MVFLGEKTNMAAKCVAKTSLTDHKKLIITYSAPNSPKIRKGDYLQSNSKAAWGNHSKHLQSKPLNLRLPKISKQNASNDSCHKLHLQELGDSNSSTQDSHLEHGPTHAKLRREARRGSVHSSCPDLHHHLQHENHDHEHHPTTSTNPIRNLHRQKSKSHFEIWDPKHTAFIPSPPLTPPPPNRLNHVTGLSPHPPGGSSPRSSMYLSPRSPKLLHRPVCNRTKSDMHSFSSRNGCESQITKTDLSHASSTKELLKKTSSLPFSRDHVTANIDHENSGIPYGVIIAHEHSDIDLQHKISDLAHLEANANLGDWREKPNNIDEVSVSSQGSILEENDLTLEEENEIIKAEAVEKCQKWLKGLEQAKNEKCLDDLAGTFTVTSV